MRNNITYLLLAVFAAISFTGCGSGRVGSTNTAPEKEALPPLPQISRNDSLRFKMFYFEAVRQQAAGNFDVAYDLVRHCLDINPNAAEAYFMLSSYDGVLKGDSAALADMQKAASLDPLNNAYLERLATGFLRVKNIPEATKAYERLAKNSPERSDVLDILTKLYAQQKDYDNMLKAIERIEQLEGSSEQTTLSKMRVYSLQGKKQEEFNTLKAMSDAHPNDMNYHVMMGNWLLQAGRPQEALKEYTLVLGQEPENTMAMMSMIDYYKAVGDRHKADSVQDAMLISPKTPVDSKVTLMRQVVANNESKGGDSTEVLGLFHKILSKPQKTSDMAELYAAYLTLKKMPQDSISAALEQVLAISPDNVGARVQLIQAVWARQDFKKVVELSRRALDYNPDEMVFYYFLGLAYVQEDEKDKALDVIKKGVSLVDDNSDPGVVSDFYSIIGDIYHDKGFAQQAYAAYDSCLQWKDDNLGCLNNYAYYLSVEGKHLGKAEQMSYRTVQAEPNNSTFLDTYAWILFKQKKYADAAQYIDMAVKNDTAQSGVIMEHAGDIHAMNGDTGKALEYWQKALKAGGVNDKAIMRKIKQKKYVEDK